jgi:cell division protein FtsB
MLKTKLVAAGLILAGSLGGVAMAQDAPRFRMERANGGFVVMDTQTGNTSFCRERGGEFVCDTTADRKAADSTVEMLQKKITELEARIEALESGRAMAHNNLPSEQEFEQTLNFMERFFKRFIDIVKGLDSDAPPEKKAPTSGRSSEQL